MTVFALYNIKGGVGKTSACVNLAYLAAGEGRQTLICDLDPQGAASYNFRIRTGKKLSAKKLLRKRGFLEKNIKATDYNHLDLLPSDFSYRNIDILLNRRNKPKKQLKRLLSELKEEYEYIFIDSPPNITLHAENVFRAADCLLLPFIPSPLSLLALRQLLDFFDKKQMDGRRIMPFFSLVDSRKKMHKEMTESVRKEYPVFLKTSIPYSSAVEKMVLYRKPLPEFTAGSAVSRKYAELWEEIKQRLNL